MIDTEKINSQLHFRVESQSPLLILGATNDQHERGSTVNFHFCMERRSPLLIGGGGGTSVQLLILRRGWISVPH